MHMKGTPASSIIATVAWGLNVDATVKEISTAKAVLTRHMRKKHPGKKFQVVRDRSPDRTENALFAVLLDG